MKILLFSLLIMTSGLGTTFGDPITAQTFSEEKIHFIDEQIMIMADISNNQDTHKIFHILHK